jgi:predicted transcriptional regulator
MKTTPTPIRRRIPAPILPDATACRRDITTVAKFIYGCIVASCATNGPLSATHSDLARYLNVSRHTVLRSIRLLTDKGLVRRASGGGRCRAYVCLPEHIPTPAQLAEMEEQERQWNAQRCA